MTPGARVQAAVEILDEIGNGNSAERALTNWARRSRFAGSKDRAAVRDHVFQALRALRSYRCLGGGASGRAVMIGALRAEGCDLAEIFTGIGHSPAPLSAQEETAGQPPVDAGDRLNLPDWMLPLFTSSLGGETAAEATAKLMQERAPVMLRVNTRKATADTAIATLAAHGVTATLAPSATTALIVTDGARKIASAPAYLDGLVELQDGASQSAMALVDIPEQARVLDYCAGGGGKVLALAARAEALWFAHDVAPHRMKDLPERARRAGVRVEQVEDSALTDHSFDLVLCDVPCSGSGTWRRSPDAKWRLTRSDLEHLNTTQDQILDRAAQLVAPMGQLVYTTCSLFTNENEARIDAFLARNPRWQADLQKRWPVSKFSDGFFLTRLKVAG